jgi:hypothetical protein
MYKITIDLSEWGTDDEVLTIETFDFEKIEIIKEFIEFQQDHGWAVDYEAVEYEEDEEEDEDEESEDDEYFYDEESDAWYWYDEENDEWVEVEDEDEEDKEDEESEEGVVEANGDTYIFNITHAQEEK